MSLVCGECNNSLAKSESLPGREGTLVHPVLRVISNIKELQRGTKSKPQYTQSDENIALCFECIEKHIPETRKHILTELYSFFEMEMQIKAYEKKALSGDEFVSGLKQIDKRLSGSLKALTNNCLLTGMPIGTGVPYFIANVIDSENSSKGQGFFGPTYQILGKICESNIRIPISFDAFRKTFPELFEGLSCSIKKTENPNAKRRPTDIYLGPGMKEALEASNGKPIDAILAKMLKGAGDMRIIYRDEKQRSRR